MGGSNTADLQRVHTILLPKRPTETPGANVRGQPTPRHSNTGHTVVSQPEGTIVCAVSRLPHPRNLESHLRDRNRLGLLGFEPGNGRAHATQEECAAQHHLRTSGSSTNIAEARRTLQEHGDYSPRSLDCVLQSSSHWRGRMLISNVACSTCGAHSIVVTLGQPRITAAKELFHLPIA